ncbi:MAG: serine/threonine protein kinase [Deltaproteobacteria bacterium]|nr:serine/threonine protein kinase [Deltaproteobacteria bacterium]
MSGTLVGRTMGGYVLGRELGRGGMGAVYLGSHALLGRPAAIKLLLPQYSRDHAAVERFFNEARAATAVRHPGIVEIFDFGFADDGSAFIVMELLDGETLAARLARVRALPVGHGLAIARQIALALTAAHRGGIVHRDLKPDNVFLVPDAEVAIRERVKVLDFGIAKLAQLATSAARTQTGMLLGTPYYMSPEQCRGGGGPLDGRSDLYALGCILFEIVCGRVPFIGEGPGEIIGAHLHVAPPRPRQLVPDLAPCVEELILRLLAKRAEDRPASAAAVVDEIVAMAGAVPALAIGGVTGLTPPPSISAQVAMVGLPPADTTLGLAAGTMRRRAVRPMTLGALSVAAAIAMGATVALVARGSRPRTAAALAEVPAPTLDARLDLAAVARDAAPPDALVAPTDARAAPAAEAPPDAGPAITPATARPPTPPRQAIAHATRAPAPAPAPPADLDAQLERAREAARADRWGAALAICRGLGAPSEAIALVCGLAACHEHDRTSALGYLGALPASRAVMLRQSCLRSGTNLD